MNSQALKPCPFCGGAARLDQRETESLWNHNDATFSHVSCGDCEIEGRDFCDDPSGEEAIEWWNTRAAPAPVPDAVEGVEVVGYQWLDTAHYRRAIPRYVDHAGVALWHELMTVAQHNRIVSALQASAMVVPEGYKLVPIEPTAAQCFTAAFNLCNEFGDEFVRDNKQFALAAYRSLVAASPSAKGGE